MNVNKSELLTRDESEGDRCLGDTSDLRRMHASHSKMDTGGDGAVGGTRSESITTGYSVTVRRGGEPRRFGNRPRAPAEDFQAVFALLTFSCVVICIFFPPSFEVQVFGRSYIFGSVTVRSEMRTPGTVECFRFFAALRG